ncbi:FtsB family cell division protein [Nocardioides speluncae]|uniref:FtsB family cell division protein n=1 Tax=Nocardioides speluncae TaxID=2670337 RepID=UPI000D699CF4|nr:septum formation initiator family protein [Nocardioides speluncae]
MPDSRGTPPRGRRPRGRAGPGRPDRSTAGRSASDTGSQPRVGAERPPRPRLTGRAAILVLVVSVLTVSYASSLRAYLEQRQHIGELKSTIAERTDSINKLEKEKWRWSDPAYVQAQARERFGYVMPGEKAYQVVDEDGNPLGESEQLTEPDRNDPEPKAWWEDAWGSVELAGNPPAPGEKEKPAGTITAPPESSDAE